MKEELSVLKKDLSKKEFWVIQLLNVSLLLKTIALSLAKAACWLIVLRLIFSDLHVSSETKHQILNLAHTLYLSGLIVLCVGTVVRGKLQWPSAASSYLAFVLLGGFSEGAYPITTVSMDLGTYSPLFGSAILFTLLVHLLVKTNFEKNVTVYLTERNEISWQADSRIDLFLTPKRTSSIHQLNQYEEIEVNFGLRYSFYTLTVVSTTPVKVDEPLP